MAEKRSGEARHGKPSTLEKDAQGRETQAARARRSEPSSERPAPTLSYWMRIVNWVLGIHQGS